MTWPEAFVIVSLLASGVLTAWMFLNRGGRGGRGVSETAKILEFHRERERRQWRKEDERK